MWVFHANEYKPGKTGEEKQWNPETPKEGYPAFPCVIPDNERKQRE